MCGSSSLTPSVYHVTPFLGPRCPPAGPIRQASDPFQWIWFRVAPPSECLCHNHAKVKTAVETLTNDSAHGSLWAHADTKGPKGWRSRFPDHKKSLEYVTYCTVLRPFLFVLWGRCCGRTWDVDVDLHDYIIVDDGLRWTCVLRLITLPDLWPFYFRPPCSLQGLQPSFSKYVFEASPFLCARIWKLWWKGSWFGWVM